MNKETCVVALKREFRTKVQGDWLGRIRGMEGVEIIGSTPYRAQIRADSSVMRLIKAELASTCHIEPLQPHSAY